MPVPPKFHSSLNSKKANDKKRDRPKFLLFSDLFLMDSVQKMHNLKFYSWDYVRYL